MAAGRGLALHGGCFDPAGCAGNDDLPGQPGSGHDRFPVRRRRPARGNRSGQNRSHARGLPGRWRRLARWRGAQRCFQSGRRSVSSRPGRSDEPRPKHRTCTEPLPGLRMHDNAGQGSGHGPAAGPPGDRRRAQDRDHRYQPSARLRLRLRLRRDRLDRSPRDLERRLGHSPRHLERRLGASSSGSLRVSAPRARRPSRSGPARSGSCQCTVEEAQGDRGHLRVVLNRAMVSAGHHDQPAGGMNQLSGQLPRVLDGHPLIALGV